MQKEVTVLWLLFCRVRLATHISNRNIQIASRWQ